MGTRRTDGNPTPEISSPQYTRNRISSPSLSLDEVNIPTPLSPTTTFIYNYYTVDERVNPPRVVDSRGNPLPLSKIPRYARITWGIPSLSDQQAANPSRSTQPTLTLQDHSGSIMKQDEFFNPGFTSHGFTSVDEILQGTVDVENYSKLLGDTSPSIFEMIKNQVENLTVSGSVVDPNSLNTLESFTEVYTRLANFPLQSLGLNVYDERGNPVGDEKGLGTVVGSTKLNLQVNNLVLPDVFENTTVKREWENLTTLKNSYGESLRSGGTREGVGISPVFNEFSLTSDLTQPVGIIGYTIERWRVTPTGKVRERIYYVEDPNTNVWEDREVLYGEKYLYSIRTVGSVKILTYSEEGTRVGNSTLYVSSHPTTVVCEAFEFTPPPPPDEIRFTFDHVKRNIILSWGTPVNPQGDIVGFQIFRRASVREPFELITQYSWDSTLTGTGGRRYSTGERVDPNFPEGMNPEDRYLLRTTDKPVYSHADGDFTVDTEFYISSDYIYTLCSVDAHGMISNYSSQWRVTFDPYRNRLISQIVCDGGCPKQYPNMYLRSDAFVDTMKWEGDESRLIDLHFTPEYLKVRDEKGVIHRVVEGDSYYVLQMINLDNQKSQILRINLKDTSNLTS